MRVTTLLNLEDIMLSEQPVTKRQVLHDSTYMWYPERSDSQRQNVDRELPGAQGERNGELVFTGDTLQSDKMKGALEMMVMEVAQQCEWT